ncbi:MAG: serine hydrolase [Selenomonadaceae bacterium]|nr:serine hydrolase [Selenomonadaceae bacterium]
MKNLDDELAAMIGDGATQVVGLGVMAFKGGKEIYSYFGGRRHINPDKKMTRTTLLRAASVSKMFTVFSIMQLVEQGKINLHDDASKYLGFELRNPNFPSAPITLEMLACHTSSLRDGENYTLPPQNFSATEPGKFFRYCNLNYSILGTIIERVTGERFDIYQRNHILKQLEIGGGYVVSNFDAKTFNRLGTIYRTNAAQIDDYKFRPRSNFSRYKIGTNATIFAPQGGLRLSFEDLGKTLQMLMNRGEFRGRRVLSEKSFDAIISPHWIYDGTNGDTYGGVMENYGLGTYKIGGASRARLCRNFEVDLIGHSGEAYGLISGLYFIPNTRDGVIFMINGTAIDVDDERSRGEFSGGYIWEEKVMDPVCRFLVDD